MPGKTSSKYGKYDKHDAITTSMVIMANTLNYFFYFEIHFGRHLTKVALWFFSGGAPIAPMQEYLGDRGFKPAGGGRVPADAGPPRFQSEALIEPRKTKGRTT
jgi:hypothetical protein